MMRSIVCVETGLGQSQSIASGQHLKKWEGLCPIQEREAAIAWEERWKCTKCVCEEREREGEREREKF